MAYVLISTIPNPGCGPEVKVTDLEYSYKHLQNILWVLLLAEIRAQNWHFFHFSNNPFILDHTCAVVPTKSDSDVIFCLQLLSKTSTCALHLS